MSTSHGDMSMRIAVDCDTIKMRSQAEGAKQFFSTGEYSDLTIACKWAEWKVHKFRLCGQSDFFHKACSAQFKEASENKISLNDGDPQVVEAMLQYLYTGSYGDAGNGPNDMPSILLDVSMFTISDKYSIESLKEEAATKFGAHCELEWKTPQFTTAVQQVYGTAARDEALKELVLTTMKKHLTALFRSRKTFDEFHKVLRSVSSFSADILGMLGIEDGVLEKKFETEDLGEPIKFKWIFNCPQCTSEFTVDVSLGADMTFCYPQGHIRTWFNNWVRYGKHAPKA